jgi:hypothetical protein
LGANQGTNPAEDLPKGIYRRGGSYCITVADSTGRRIRRSFGQDLAAAVAQKSRASTQNA